MQLGHSIRYNILQISARSLLNCGHKRPDGYRFYFDTTVVSNATAITKTVQADCGMFRQLLQMQFGKIHKPELPVSDELLQEIVYLDFSGIFDRRPVGKIKDLQELAEWLFRPEGITLGFEKEEIRFVAFERLASMSRENRLAFLRADSYDELWKRMTLGMQIGQCQLAKLYAYNGLLFSSGRIINYEHIDDRHIIVVDNPRSIIKNVDAVTVEDDGSDAAMRKYQRVEKTLDVEVLEFDGEGLISKELGASLDPYSYSNPDHFSFQIRLPYIKGVVHTVDFQSLFAELGVSEIVDIEGVRHRVADVDMILTKSMCKGWGWMRENGLTWRDYLDRCRRYGHSLFVTGMDRRNRDGLTELNYQLLNTAAITAEEYRPENLPFHWTSSPEADSQTWLTKATEAAYYNYVANEPWQLDYFDADRENPELEYTDRRRMRARLLHKNPAFLKERIFQKELADKAKSIREKFALGKLQVSGDTRYLSDDLMRLLAELVKPTSPAAYEKLLQECLRGAVVYAPQPSYPVQEQLTILRNPHISRNEEALVTPLAEVGPLREKYLSHLYYVAMVDSRSLIPDRLGGADYDGDTVHVYAEPLLNECIRRNYAGGLENENNLPLLKIPSADALIADAHDWQARFQTVRSTFSSRIGQISNAALRRSILAYDESTPEHLREQYRKETEILTILTGLEIDSAKTGVKPDLSAYLGKKQPELNSAFLESKNLAAEPAAREWYEPSKAKRIKAYFAEKEWNLITANLERTPYYARELGKQTKRPKVIPEESAGLFSFAADPTWKEKIDPAVLERMRSIIADYEEAIRRVEAFRHPKPSEGCRRDIRRILFSRNQENDVSVESLYHQFDRYTPYTIETAYTRLQDYDWQFTPPKDRVLALYEIFQPNSPPFDAQELLCDFRCGGYRILGDILEDLNGQYRSAVKQKHKGTYKTDTEQMIFMMHGLLDEPDYRAKLIQNCVHILHPVFRQEVANIIPFEDALKCAELLGKRQFILEVLPSTALELALDRSKPEPKKKAWWKLW